MKDISSEEKELLRKLFVKVNSTQNVLLNVVNGHLIIEDILRKLALAKLSAPEKFDDMNLSSSQIVSLVEVLYSKEIDEWVYMSIKTLNKLRNKCAHVLDHPNIDDLINNFTSVAYSHCIELSTNEEKKKWYSIPSDTPKSDLKLFKENACNMQNQHIRLPEALIYIAKYLFNKLKITEQF